MEEIGIKNCGIIELPAIGNQKQGFLSYGEAKEHIPFNIKRVYYIYRIKDINTVRGRHAHKKLEQVIFCLNGSFKFILDDGTKKIEKRMTTPNIGLYIGPYVWHEMKDFSEDVVIISITSDYYNENDYIRDYKTFKKMIHERVNKKEG